MQGLAAPARHRYHEFRALLLQRRIQRKKQRHAKRVEQDADVDEEAFNQALERSFSYALIVSPRSSLSSSLFSSLSLPFLSLTLSRILLFHLLFSSPHLPLSSSSAGLEEARHLVLAAGVDEGEEEVESEELESSDDEIEDEELDEQREAKARLEVRQPVPFRGFFSLPVNPFFQSSVSPLPLPQGEAAAEAQAEAEEAARAIAEVGYGSASLAAPHTLNTWFLVLGACRS